MLSVLKAIVQLLRDTFVLYHAKKLPLMAAGLSYFALISISPTLIFVTAIVGFLGSSENFQSLLRPRLENLLGDSLTQSIYSLVDQAQTPAGLAASALGFIILLLAATRFFVYLHTALNVVWEKKEDNFSLWKGVKEVFYQRLVSFLLILSTAGFLFLLIGFDIVLSLTIDLVSQYVPIPPKAPLWTFLGFLFSTTALLLLLMTIYRQVPDARIGWRDVWPGALLALLLMSFIRFLLGRYFGAEAMASLYGLTGTLVILLVANFLFIQAFLFGATLSRVYAKRFGSYSEN